MTHDAIAANRGDVVPLEEAKEQVRRVCARLGLLHYAFAQTLVDELGENRGRQVAMNAIKLYAIKIGEDVKAKVDAQEQDNSPENYGEDLPIYGMHDGREVVHVDGESRTRVTGCVMAKVWRDLKAEDLGRIYCYVDPCKYMAYNPNFKLVHHKAMPDGDDYCEMSVKQATEKDREQFAAKDADLSMLDR